MTTSTVCASLISYIVLFIITLRKPKFQIKTHSNFYATSVAYCTALYKYDNDDDNDNYYYSGIIPE